MNKKTPEQEAAKLYPFSLFDNLDSSMQKELQRSAHITAARMYMGEVDKLKEGVEILKELCQLKNYKDTVGKDTFYDKRQPELWKMANDFLNELVKYSGAAINKEQQ